MDDAILNMAATPPGIVRAMRKDAGITGFPGHQSDLESDRKRHKGAMWVLNNKVAKDAGPEPFCMTASFAAYDDAMNLPKSPFTFPRP